MDTNENSNVYLGPLGPIITITNTSTTYNVTFKHNSGSSSSTNRFYFPNQSDFVLEPLQTIYMEYRSGLWYQTMMEFSPHPGDIIVTGRTTAPPNWLLCDGTAVSRTNYAGLFTAIGTTYGAGDGSTTFNLPDLRQKFPLGKAASGTGSSLGSTGGAIDHVHTVDIPSTTSSSDGAHTHTVTVPSEDATVLLNLGQVGRDGTFTSSSDGAHTHTVDPNSVNSGANNPPFIALNFIIKV